MVVIEAQHVLNRDNPGSPKSRASAIQYLLSSLVNLVRVANTDERNTISDSSSADQHRKTGSSTQDSSRKEIVSDDKISRRSRVPPDIWQDTLSLLCHSDPTVRSECATAL